MLESFIQEHATANNVKMEQTCHWFVLKSRLHQIKWVKQKKAILNLVRCWPTLVKGQGLPKPKMQVIPIPNPIINLTILFRLVPFKLVNCPCWTAIVSPMTA